MRLVLRRRERPGRQSTDGSSSRRAIRGEPIPRWTLSETRSGSWKTTVSSSSSTSAGPRPFLSAPMRWRPGCPTSSPIPRFSPSTERDTSSRRFPASRVRPASCSDTSRRRVGVKRVAVIHDPNAYGTYFRDRARDLASELSYRFVGSREIGSRDPETAEKEVSEVEALEPDAVILALYPAQARKVMEAKAKLGWKTVRMVATGPLTDEQYLDVGGGAAEGTLGFCHYPDPESAEGPGLDEYRALMKKYSPGETPQPLLPLRLRLRKAPGRGPRARFARSHPRELR